MSLRNLKVGDLEDMMQLINHTTLVIGAHALGLLDDEAIAEESLELGLKEFAEGISDDYWTVARLLTLKTLKQASNEVLEGLLATQEVR